MDESTPLIPDSEVPDEAAIESGSQSNGELTRHEKAAWIIEEITRATPVLTSAQVPSSRHIRSVYLFFHNTEWVRQAAVFLLVVLSFFELPSWCSKAGRCVSPDGSFLPLSGVPYLTPWESITVNLALLGILIYFAFVDYFTAPVPLHNHANRLYGLLFLLSADAVYTIVFGGYPPVRIAHFLRPMLPLFYWRGLRECTSSVLAVAVPFLDVVFFVVLFTLLFGWVVTLLFHEEPEADYYFGDLLKGLYSAFTSLTTADWPMQAVGIIGISRPSTILFIAFIIIGVFLLLNLLLAVVYNAYTGSIEELVLTKFAQRRRSINIAYNVLSGSTGDGDDDDDDEVGQVTLPDVSLMFKELRKNKKHAHLDEDKVDMVFTALDDDKDNMLSRREFSDVIDVLQLKFVEDLEYPTPVEQFMPKVYETEIWQRVSEYVKSDRFNYVFDAFMLFNVIIVVIETTMDLRGTDTATSVIIFSLIECVFSFVYLGEMMLKVMAMGFQRYWSDVGNQFDFWVTWLLLGASVYVLWPFVENDSDIVRLFILLRCLRLFTLLADIPRFRRLVRVFSVLIPASLPLFAFMFLSIFEFAALGTEMFGGLVYQGNPSLNPSTNTIVEPYVSASYWVLNFNDLAAGWFTLFCTVIVDYMTELAAVTSGTSSLGKWTVWYWVVSYITNTLIVGNCVIAFVVDLFVMEDENAAEECSDLLIRDVQSRYGTRRIKVIQSKSTAQQVYASMFKERIDQIMAEEPEA